MNKFVFVLGVLLVMLLAPAQAQSVREGVVEQIVPIENKGADESKGGQIGRTLGRTVGRLGGMFAGKAIIESDVGNSTAGRVAGGVVFAGDHSERAGGEIGAKIAGPGESLQYMVKIRLDSGRVLSIPQPRALIEGLKEGDRVQVEGRGDDARIRPVS